MGRFYNPRSKICKHTYLHLDLSIARDFDNSITGPFNAAKVASSDCQGAPSLRLRQTHLRLVELNYRAWSERLLSMEGVRNHDNRQQKGGGAVRAGGVRARILCNRSRLSYSCKRNVTGPSFVSDTCISAAKIPLATG